MRHTHPCATQASVVYAAHRRKTRSDAAARELLLAEHPTTRGQTTRARKGSRDSGLDADLGRTPLQRKKKSPRSPNARSGLGASSGEPPAPSRALGGGTPEKQKKRRRPHQHDPRPSPPPLPQIDDPEPEPDAEAADDAQVRDLLEALDLPRLLPTFRQHGVTDDTLDRVTTKELRSMGVPPAEALQVAAAVNAIGESPRNMRNAAFFQDVAKQQLELEAKLHGLNRAYLANAEVAEDMCCPISCEIMNDPVGARVRRREWPLRLEP